MNFINKIKDRSRSRSSVPIRTSSSLSADRNRIRTSIPIPTHYAAISDSDQPVHRKCNSSPNAKNPNNVYENAHRNSKASSEILEKGAFQTLSSGDEENVLTDEQDIFSGNSGTLVLTDDSSCRTPDEVIPHSLHHQETQYKVPCDGVSSSSNVSFEVVSAEVIREGRSGHVNYSILINTHKDSNTSARSVVVRRYSDFENLHHLLKKKFSSILSSISFPRKIITGNLTSATIAKRSTAFEQYLSHLFSFFEIRYSKEFLHFFIKDAFQEAKRNFLQKDFNAAIPLFEKSLPLIEKLYGILHAYVCECLCGLVVSYVSVEKENVALSCVEMALNCVEPEGSGVDNELRCAVVQTAVRLYWMHGKDKTDLEEKLQVLKTKGVDVDSIPDLSDILMFTFKLNQSEDA